jgi:GNAT superfamily N-acetyltransferase
MVAGLVLSRVESVPADVDELLTPSREEGHDLVERFVAGWESGCNRFDRSGEVFLEARLAGRLVALGGLNRDPYLEDRSVGRIRHVYVHPDARGAGVGRLLVAALLEHARGHFRRVRLRAGPEGAAGFYLALGFVTTSGEDDSTHELRF